MAHSLRSKSKLKAKSEKTTNPSSDYFKTAEARRQRLAQKMKDNVEKQRQIKEEKAADEMADEEKDSKAAPIDKKDIDYSKVSTHGWRKTRTANYKKKKATKNKSMKF